MLKILTVVGRLLFWGGLLVLMPVLEHDLGVSRFWTIPMIIVGWILLSIRDFIQKRPSEDV